MTPTEKARDMRNAIDAMEMAMMGWPELIDLPEKWGEPRHHDELGVKVPGNCGQVYRICDALAELTRIINDPEYLVNPAEGSSRRHDAKLDAAAKEIYDQLPYDGAPGTTKPAWVPFGNSLKQDDARKLAREASAVNPSKD